MNFTIISLGNIEYLAMILNSVAMICGTGDFTRLVAVGFVIGLLFIGLQCIFDGGQKINLHHSFLCFLCYLCMFGPSCTVNVEDAYTGGVRTVDNLPLGVGIAGASISGIGYGLTKMMEQGYSPADRTSEHQFAEPLRILNQLRSSGEKEAIFEKINAVMGPRANGQPSDSKKALINYLSECTMTKIQLGAITATKLFESPWGEAFAFNSDAHTTFLPIGGLAEETVTCKAGFAHVDNMLKQVSNPHIRQIINASLHLKSEDGTTVATDFDKINGAMTALNASLNGAQDYIQLAVVDSVYRDAAKKLAVTQHDTASAIAINQAIQQRNAQWSSESTMFLDASRALMAFFEGFIYAITPILAFLMAVGSFGISLVGKYFLTIVWIQLWLPILSITNLYILTGARSAITDASLGTSASFYVLDSLYAETSTWVATGGMLAAATPMLALFLVTGSTYAFTSLAGRLGGQDHYNERITTPDAVAPAAVMSQSQKFTADRLHGPMVSGSEAIIPKVDFGKVMSSTVSSAQGLVNANSMATMASIGETYGSGKSINSVETLQTAIGQNVANNMVDGHQTVLQRARQDSEFSKLSEGQQIQAIGALSMAIGGGASASLGDKDSLIGKAAKALGIKVGLDGKAEVSNEATHQDTNSVSDSQDRQFGGSRSSSDAKSLNNTLTKGYQAALQNISADTWAKLESANKNTNIGLQFGKMRDARQSFEKADQASRSIGHHQQVDAVAFAKSLEGTEAWNYLSGLERTAEGRAAGLAGKAEKWADILGSRDGGPSQGNLRLARVVSALDWVVNQADNPQMQATLGGLISNSGLPINGQETGNAYRNEGLKRPGNADSFIPHARDGWKKEDNKIANGTPTSVNYADGVESANTLHRMDDKVVTQQASVDGYAALARARAQAVHGLEQTPRTSWANHISSSVLKDGLIDSVARFMGFDNKSPTAKDSQTGWSNPIHDGSEKPLIDFNQWFQPHQQSIGNLTNAQATYMEAHHNLQNDPGSNANWQAFINAYEGLRQEIRGTVVGDKSDEKITQQEWATIDKRTNDMINQIEHVYEHPEQGEASKITQFNTAFQLRTRPRA